jgi:PAS domain S-box-containing protein
MATGLMTTPAPRELEDLLEGLARTIGETLGFRTVAVNLHRPEWDDFAVVAVHGDDEARAALLGVTYPAHHWDDVLQDRWEQHGLHLVPHGEFDWSGSTSFVPDLPDPADATAWHAEDALFAALHDLHGRLVGVISVDEPRSGRVPGGDELDALRRLATQAARTIEVAQASESARRNQRSLEALFAVSEKVNESESAADVLQSVCDGVRSALGFQHVVIELADLVADRYLPLAAAGTGIEHEALRLDIPVEQMRRVYDPDFEVEGCYLLPREAALERVGAEPSGFASHLNGRGDLAWNRHWLIVPLFAADGDEMGFIWADDPADRLLPTRERLLALRLFANHAGRALVNQQQLTALQRASDDRRTLIDHSPVAIVRLDEQGRIVSLNPAAEALYGYAEPEVVGHEPPWIQEGARAEYRARVERQLGTDEVQVEEFTDLRRDGSPVHVRAFTSQLHGPAGEPIGAVASLVDVTPSRIAREELAARNAELEALYGTTLELIDGLDIARVLETIVERAAALAGADAGFVYLVDEEQDALSLAVSLGEFDDLDGRLLRRGEGVSGVVWERGAGFAVDDYAAWPERRGGYDTTSYSAVAGVPIRSKDGVAGVLGVGRGAGATGFDEAALELLDRLARLASLALANARLYEHAQQELRERRQAEDALRLSQALYRKVVDNSTDVISLVDLDGMLVYVSPAQERMLGYRSEELVDTALLDLVHPGDAPVVTVALASVFEHDPPPAIAARLRHRDGHWVLFEGTPAPIHDPAGRPELVLWVSRDVTERERLAEQLRQTQKMEAVGRLAGGIAHDFNNLLTAIGGYSEVALETMPSDAPARRSVEEVRRAADRAAALTRQLLAFSRKQVLQPEVLDVNDVVRELETMLGPLLGSGVTLVTSLQEGLGRTRADRGQLEQVLMNLALNARDAMSGGGRLTVETADATLDDSLPGAVPGEYVRLSVIDTGTGMDAETLERAFEPFFTTKGPDRGTGLGLASVHGIVNQTGGGVWATSELGRGSRFDVYLPRVQEAEASVQAVPPTTPGTGSETILLVEDEEIVRELAREMLERIGYTVLVAADGAEALEVAAANEGRIDALVTDVVMPGASGPTIAAKLVARDPSLRVLFTSGYAEDAIASHGELTPGAAFLSKPFSSAALGSKLRELLDRA